MDLFPGQPDFLGLNASTPVASFGGGDVAHRAENIHGQIGFAILVTEPRP